MNSPFHYTTFSTRLEKSTRTLMVTLNRNDWNNALKLETLFEFESLLAWCTNKVEIQSIFINSSSEIFSQGYDLGQLKNYTATQLEKIHAKLSKIIFAMMQLPQTIVIDLNKGAFNLAAELSLGADIRIGHKELIVHFNHSELGLIPACGGLSFLTHHVSSSFARSWITMSSPLDASELTQSGFIKNVYSEETKHKIIQKILTNISSMSPVQRIQSKLGWFESIRNDLELGMNQDRKIAKAALITEDWKKDHIQQEQKNTEFMPAKSFSYAVKFSLIKNEESTPSH